MPPSGWDHSEVGALALVAKSLLARFRAEVLAGIHPSEPAGIKHELAIIGRHLATASPAERAVLLLAQSLYEGLRLGHSSEQLERDIRALATKHYE